MLMGGVLARNGKQLLSHKVTVAAGFAGGILCPLLMGMPPAPLVNDKIPVIALALWFCFFNPFSPAQAGPFFNSPGALPIRLAILFLENVFKANLMVSMSLLSFKTLGSLCGPLFITTLAGCGGVFCPVMNLSALDKTPQGVHDAMAGAALICFALRGDQYMAALPVSLQALTLGTVVPDMKANPTRKPLPT